MRQCLTEFAQIDPVLLEFGLFKSLPREGASSPLTVPRPHWDFDYTLISPQTLDDLALKTLLVLCALAGSSASSNTLLTPQANSGLWARLALASHEPIDCAVWQGTIGDILREADMQSGGGNKDRVTDRLQQLSDVRITASDKTGKRWWESNLISFSQSQKLGEIRVAFSPGLSARILRKQPVQYSHILLDPIRATESPAARILHAVLSNRIRIGSTARYGLGKLAEIVYLPSQNPAIIRKRQKSVEMAIEELASLGWAFQRVASSKGVLFEIRRTADNASKGANQVHQPLASSHQLVATRLPALRPSPAPRRSFGYKRFDPIPPQGGINQSNPTSRHLP